ncbi:MAG: hypothetical protein K1X79_00545 [Oligoflexia bacterium]|nr:hypothetical protein [Oligoflexia bacterium]
MAVTIGSNISALRVVRELGATSRSLSKTYERLSSGLRINGAGDDAAGLAVASGLNAKARISGRAVLNVNDGISALQVADGVSAEIGSVLQRMSELAQQAANGSLSDTQRQSLDNEYQALTQEISRLAKSTKFNDVAVLQGQQATSMTYRQLTSVGSGSGVGTHFAVNANGKYIAYYDSVAGAIKEVNTDSGAVTLVAAGVTAPNEIYIDTSGSVVGFRNAANLTGQNASGTEQLFRWDRNSNTVTQVTNNQVGTIFVGAAMSADGSTFAISSNMDYVDGGTVWNGASAGGTWGIYTFNAYTGKVRAINENSAAVHGYVSLSPTGKFAAFSSLYNPFGTNADGNAELFAVDLRGSTPSIKQATTSTGGEVPVALVSDQGEIFWKSSYNLASQNASLNPQIYKYRFATSALSQLTNNQTSDDLLQPTLSTDGRSILLVASTLSWNPSGPTSLQAYKIDTSTGAVEQATNFTSIDVVTAYAFSADGNYMAAVSNLYTSANELFTYDLGRTSTSLNIEAGGGAASSISTALGAIESTIRGLGGFALTSQTGARGALENALDNIDRLNSMRATIGSGMSRLESASRLLSTSTDLYKAAESRITDVDVASEAANLLRLQIRQQSATALLAQANLQPALTLKLLGAA